MKIEQVYSLANDAISEVLVLLAFKDDNSQAIVLAIYIQNVYGVSNSFLDSSIIFSSGELFSHSMLPGSDLWLSQPLL